MARFRPTLTIDQYQEAVRLFRVEVAEIAWSLVVSPAPIDAPRRWRPLTADESQDVFDRLMADGTRMASKDRARIVVRALDGDD